MGIYGMGQAHNLRYARQTQMSGTIRRPMMQRPMGPPPPMDMGNVSTSETVTVNNGPQGFWGFMAGLADGVFSSGILNNIGSGNSGDNGVDQLGNLKKLFPDYTIVADGDGKFTASGKDGTVVRGTYDELIDQLSKKPKSEGTSTKTEDTVSTPISNTTPTTQGPVQAPASNKYTVVKGDNVWNIAKQDLIDNGNANPSAKEIKARTEEIMQKNGLKYEADNYHCIIHPGDQLEL